MRVLHTAMMAACLAVGVANVARAEIKAEPLPASDTMEKPINFSSTGLSVADTITKFTKDTGIAVSYENTGQPNFGGPEITYDVEIKNQPANDAVRELAAALSLGILRDGNSTIRLSPNSWSGDNQRKPEPLVQLAFIRRSQSFPPSPQQRDNLQLQFRIWSGKVPFSGPAQIKLDEATDDAGHNLLMVERQQQMYYDDYPGERYAYDQSVNLQFPDPKPKKIATLKGSAVIAKPKTILRITADKLTDGPQKVDYNGGTLTIGPAKKQGDGYDFKVALTRGKIGNDDWRMMYSRVRGAQSAIVRGPDGQVLSLQNRGSSSGGKEVSMNLFIQPPRSTDGNQGQSIVPASFQWDIVTETVDQPLPFTLNNIDIP